MTTNELVDWIETYAPYSEYETAQQAVDILRQQAQEIEELKADAKRYRYLRNHCYKLKYPNSDIDRAMELNFVVSGVWADNKNLEVLDGLIDEKIGEK
jgi:hypothetical protein